MGTADFFGESSCYFTPSRRHVKCKTFWCHKKINKEHYSREKCIPPPHFSQLHNSKTCLLSSLLSRAFYIPTLHSLPLIIQVFVEFQLTVRLSNSSFSFLAILWRPIWNIKAYVSSEVSKKKKRQGDTA